MAKSKPKPRPTDNEALFLIVMRRDRAKSAMSEILHGITRSTIKLPHAEQILDYLSNMTMCLEMMLKLLSGDWSSHNVASMFETVSGQAYPDLALMESIKDAIMNQKYLLSPAGGVIDHIPEIEKLYDFLHRKLVEKYQGFDIRVDEDLPANVGPYLVANVERFYKPTPMPVTLGTDMRASGRAFLKAYRAEVEQVRSALSAFLAKGEKLKMDHFRSSSLD